MSSNGSFINSFMLMRVNFWIFLVASNCRNDARSWICGRGSWFVVFRPRQIIFMIRKSAQNISPWSVYSCNACYFKTPLKLCLWCFRWASVFPLCGDSFRALYKFWYITFHACCAVLGPEIRINSHFSDVSLNLHQLCLHEFSTAEKPRKGRRPKSFDNSFWGTFHQLSV